MYDKVKKLKSQIVKQKGSGARSLSDTIDYTAFAVAEGPLDANSVLGLLEAVWS